MKKLYTSKTQTLFTTAILLLFSVALFAQTTYNISDPEALQDQTYGPGDVIILANGVYDTDARIDFVGDGASGNPITFRAETPGGVKFTGGLKLNIGGDYCVVDGFHWQGGIGASNFIQFRDNFDYANHSTLQNCAIDGLIIDPEDVVEDMMDGSITKHRWVVLYGTYNTVTNCSFMNKTSAGALVLGEYEFNAEADACGEVGHIIRNNYFYKYTKMDPSLSNAGDSETIRIGTSEFQNVNSNAVVSNNYFVEADGENEIISNKSKGNIYNNNTFRRCRGSLVLRHGSGATVNGNVFLGENVDGTGGIRITDNDHNITNNYIQDCITVQNQAIWNNGITWMGGGDTPNVPCTSNSLTNGYQKSTNILLNNNTFVNTHSPLFFNLDRGSNDPTGNVANNLVYFSAGNPNVSDVLSGDSDNAYNNLGTALNYNGNVFTGAMLGETNADFTLESGITATPSGEIFTFSGDATTGKGADLGAYTPITDAMVGYGVGACFLDHLGANINDGDCTIEIAELLTVSGISAFDATGGSQEVNVGANVGWTAVANDAWITITPTSGSGDAIVTVTVTENPDVTDRVGTITFTQDPGGMDIVRTLTVTQLAADLSDLYDLINVGTGMPGDKVTVHSFSREEVNGVDKFNFATNTLDKDNATVWAADDGAIVAGDFRGDGEFIIYDLGCSYELDLIQYTTTDKADAFGYQIWVSTTGVEDADFSRILPTSGDLLFTAVNTTDFNQYEVSAEARYVKLIGFGRYNDIGDSRVSVWSAIGEIEFYGDGLVSSNEEEFTNTPSIYPVPTTTRLQLQNLNGVELITVYSLDGRKLMEKQLSGSDAEITFDVSSMATGSYFMTFQGEQVYQSKKFVVSH